MARKKPSIKIKRRKGELQIITSVYDDFGKVIKKQIESIPKLK